MVPLCWHDVKKVAAIDELLFRPRLEVNYAQATPTPCTTAQREGLRDIGFVPFEV